MYSWGYQKDIKLFIKFPLTLHISPQGQQEEDEFQRLKAIELRLDLLYI